MEAATGTDLADVRIHTSHPSRSAAAAVNARAFTLGSDIHFGAGEHRPGTRAGDRLLAHELVHAAQVARGGGQRQPRAEAAPSLSGREVSSTGEPAELEADAIAARVAGASPHPKAEPLRTIVDAETILRSGNDTDTSGLDEDSDSDSQHREKRRASAGQRGKKQEASRASNERRKGKQKESEDEASQSDEDGEPEDESEQEDSASEGESDREDSASEGESEHGDSGSERGTSESEGGHDNEEEEEEEEEEESAQTAEQVAASREKWASNPSRISKKNQNELVKLLDRTKVITESFVHERSRRRRQIELRIPFRTLRGEAANDFARFPQGGATPLPLLSRCERSSAKYNVDRTANKGKLYELGHLMARKSSAPKNAWLCTYMTTQTNQINQSGSWRRSELKIDRMLGISQGSRQASKPKKTKEKQIAHLASRKGPIRDGYKKIQIFYDKADPRIASHFIVSLHDSNGRCFKLFRPIHNTRMDREPEMPSDELRRGFERASRLLVQADSKAAELGPQAPTPVPWSNTRKTRNSSQREAGSSGNATVKRPVQTQWEPSGWVYDEQDRGWYPPQAYPEAHVPRPYRVLDFALRDSDARKQLKSVLHTVSKREKQVIKNVIKDGVGPRRAFTAAQRQLAEWFARHRDGGSLFSDLKPGKVPLASLPEEYHDVYQDPCNGELSHASGDNALHADHHRPMGFGGHNLFTNLLLVSREQNLRRIARQKSADLTNPNRRRSELSRGNALRDGDASKQHRSGQSEPQKHRATTVEWGFQQQPKRLKQERYRQMFAKEDEAAYTGDDLEARTTPRAGESDEDEKKGKEKVSDDEEVSDVSDDDEEVSDEEVSDDEVSRQRRKSETRNLQRALDLSRAEQSSGWSSMGLSTAGPSTSAGPSSRMDPALSDSSDEHAHAKRYAELFPEDSDEVQSVPPPGPSSSSDLNAATVQQPNRPSEKFDPDDDLLDSDAEDSGSEDDGSELS